MSSARDKAQAFTKQLVGQMVGDELLVQEGKEQEREAADDKTAGEPSKAHHEERNRRPQPRRSQSARSFRPQGR